MIEMPQPKAPADEPRETRIKRLAMRSMRRGIKEMDLILQAFATDRLARMDDAGLDLYDALLEENDHDLYQWVTGQVAPKPQYAELVAEIQTHIARG
ncbi:succinate dehydrogenase assembly factor 2 [Sulfitobacter albidus]|uniref:FAD assembly factor SdhE n=1 Tax=Sulfitobacter albidus TaxID=2829501 RepID=A0A975JF00_9RHOB|nr:succinate dehydrogenase assembly factor 2 [Sulfitobacter albidus]QUJ77097.1 succinate dehydrogenase assembly factor 2 [Sulfitobacter albidus]